jgi:hypothetical protein
MSRIFFLLIVNSFCRLKTTERDHPQGQTGKTHDSLLYSCLRDLLGNSNAARPMKLQLILTAAISCIPAHAQDSSALTISSPLEYQVFQSTTRLHGAILVRGSAPSAKHVEARVEGTSLEGPLRGRWQRLALDPSTKQFSGQLPVIAGGLYRVEIKAIDTVGQPTLLTIQNVGVGEVFVIAGQSNSTNYGEVPQKTQTGMVTTFNGTAWSLANDPQPGVQDNSRKGSFLPSFGDVLYRRYHVPIGIASVGHGSTSVRQWLPADTPIQVMPTMTRYAKPTPTESLSATAHSSQG